MRTLPTNDLIREVLGENHPIVLGWELIVQTYKIGDNFLNPDGSTSVFKRPDVAKDRDKYQMGVGRVLMIGPACYKGPKYEFWDDLFPIVGDFVTFPKYEGSFDNFAGIDIQYLQDYNVRRILPDPSKSGAYFHFVGN